MKKGARIGFGVLNVAVAALVAWGVFRGLPTRWWVVDGGAAIVCALMAASGVLLLADHRSKELVTRVAGFVVLALGLAVFAALALTASWLYGVYGPVGKGGSALFALVALLVFPYVVVLPAVLLAWVGPRARTEPS
jgi:cation transporter-like permease